MDDTTPNPTGHDFDGGADAAPGPANAAASLEGDVEDPSEYNQQRRLTQIHQARERCVKVRFKALDKAMAGAAPPVVSDARARVVRLSNQ